ncbi:acylphosphatase [Phototrophicus methaneseepsis]|uniref:acylphosphatase n=1 Tax=Phototrophicus methaneseepsis TaxID=2710758 RepID=A0A7S8EE15_9CHLR|nr:acylphosphatase [Phototrophicus methaneseepsis]
MTKQRLHAIVHGRVQGVSYRFFTKQMADTLDVTGYIYNQPDGTVEVVAEGVPQELERLLTFLYEGSPAAQVERVDFEYTQPTGEYLAFTIRFILLD